MRLRTQLAAFAALTLVLPWAGWRYVQEMEQALRQGLEQSLVASAGTVAAAIGGELAARGPRTAARSGEPLYAQRLERAPTLDGFRDDWSSAADASHALAGGHRFWVGVHDASLYVFVDAADADLVYQGQPGATPYGDRVLLSVTPERGTRSWLLFMTRAPGGFRAQRTAPPEFAPGGGFEERVQAAWQETGSGYAVEARLPLAAARASLGLAVVDVDPAAGGYTVTTRTSWPAEDAGPGPLIFKSDALERRLAAFTQRGERFRVVDADGYVLSDVGRVEAAARGAATADAGPAERLVALMLRDDDPEYRGLESPPGRLADARLAAALGGETATAWYSRAPGASAVVTAAVPIREGGDVVGAVVLERASEAVLTLTNTALVRLVALTAGAGLVALVALLGYATFLSLRVRRLARAAEDALGPRGEIRAELPGRAARDELGDLARSFAALLGRLGEYTQYQRTLTSKLSHELRTPAAIISTSLDNLEQELGSPKAPTYLERLRHGAHRLDAILSAMSEATRIEQAIGETEPRRFELAPVVESCCAAYADIHPERRFDYACTARDTAVKGSEDLVAQMLDKLVDNAVGFSPPDSTITVRVERRDGEVGLRVANRGPRLPEAMRGRLFDSLVSVREHRGDRPHLGLGLRVVALIAEFHDGRALADNLPGGDGVELTVWMRAAP